MACFSCLRFRPTEKGETAPGHANKRPRLGWPYRIESRARPAASIQAKARLADSSSGGTERKRLSLIFTAKMNVPIQSNDSDGAADNGDDFEKIPV